MFRRALSKTAAPVAAGAVGAWRLRRAYAGTAGAQEASSFSVGSVMKTYPVSFSCGIACVKGIWADIVAQKTFEGAESIDWTRVAAFGTFGFVYMGGVQYFWYVKVFSEKLFTSVPAFAAKTLAQKLQDGRGCATVVAQVVLDQFFIIPFFFFPFFYTIKTAILGDPAERAARGSSLFDTAFTTYSANIKEDMLTSWSTFLPCNVVNFFFLPMHLRIPFMTACSAAYCVLLSYMRGGEPEATSAVLSFQSALRLATECGVCSVEKMEAAMKKYIDKSTGAISEASFKAFFNELGVVDPRSLASIYEVFDINKDGKVTVQEFTSAMFALAGFGTPEETALFIFRACDLDNNSSLEKKEVFVMVRSMLRMRERLLINTSSERATQMLVAGSKASAESGSSAASRLKTLKARSQHYSKLETVDAVLEKEAEEIRDAIFQEADANHDNKITAEEFSAWVKKDTSNWKALQMLFKTLAPKPA